MRIWGVGGEILAMELDLVGVSTEVEGWVASGERVFCWGKRRQKVTHQELRANGKGDQTRAVVSFT